VILPYRVGEGRAQDLLLTGRAASAEEAHAIGLVDQIAEPGEGEALLTSWIEANILDKSASSLRFAYRAARLALARRLADDLPEIERLYLEELMATPDANEGIASFLERRRPAFTS
jgi:cyclohexa-1,5-dienecarbonyl-CoA hydratase